MTNVIMAVDSNWLRYIHVPIVSAIENTPNIQIKVLTRGITESAFRQRIPFSFVEQIPLKKEIDACLASWITPSTMDRLMIPSLVDWDKAIYLDVDTVVCSDLTKLFKMDTGECGIAAKQSTRLGYKDTISYCAKTKADWQKLNRIFGKHPNFNAGVMLMDLEKMRENNAETKMLIIVNETKCNDQIALATYSQGRFERLPTNWNVWVGIDDNRMNPSDYKILHYVGGRKPWENNARQAKYFRKYYRS